jgi:Uma2 family endonuclease
MSALLAPPAAPVVPPAAGPRPLRWTVDQYQELGKAGLFDNVRTMLIHGEILTMPNPKPAHDTAMALVEDWLRTVFAVGHHVRTQKAFNVGTDNSPGPDIAVVPGSIRDYATDTPRTAVLIVEIAESSLFMDTTTKAELYATAGVADYWVVDLAGRQLLVYREPAPLPTGLGATAYRNHRALGPDDAISPLAVPTASVRVAELLP